MTEAQFITLSLALAVLISLTTLPHSIQQMLPSVAASPLPGFFPLAFQTVRLWDVNELFTCVSPFLPLKHSSE